MKLRCIYSLRKKKWWKETNMALTFLLTHIDLSLTVYTSFLRFKVVFHVQFILLHEPEPNCLLANCQAPFIGETGRKKKVQRVRLWRYYMNRPSIDFQCLSVKSWSFQLRLVQNFQTSVGGQAVNGFILSDLQRIYSLTESTFMLASNGKAWYT